MTSYIHMYCTWYGPARIKQHGNGRATPEPVRTRQRWCGAASDLPALRPFGRLLRKAPEAWCRVRAADEEYPCRAPQRRVRAGCNQSCTTRTDKSVWRCLVNAEAVPGVLLFCSLRLLFAVAAIPTKRRRSPLVSVFASASPASVQGPLLSLSSSHPPSAVLCLRDAELEHPA